MVQPIAADEYPHNIKTIGDPLREIRSAYRQVGRGGVNGEVYLSPRLEIDVHDRVGGAMVMPQDFSMAFSTGDAGTGGEAGLGTWRPASIFPGDTTVETLDQVRSLAQGGPRAGSASR